MQVCIMSVVYYETEAIPFSVSLMHIHRNGIEMNISSFREFKSTDPRVISASEYILQVIAESEIREARFFSHFL